MKNFKPKFLQFPKKFLWGTATSAHQIEGNNINSDWWFWEQQNKGKILNVAEKKFKKENLKPAPKLAIIIIDMSKILI